jgi:hypothetical protein
VDKAGHDFLSCMLKPRNAEHYGGACQIGISTQGFHCEWGSLNIAQHDHLDDSSSAINDCGESCF